MLKVQVLKAPINNVSALLSLALGFFNALISPYIHPYRQCFAKDVGVQDQSKALTIQPSFLLVSFLVLFHQLHFELGFLSSSFLLNIP